MKKAKVILSAIAVLAVVGGALAFKAKAENYCLYTLNGAGVCPSFTIIQETVPGDDISWASTRAIGDCPETVNPLSCTLTFDVIID